MQVSGHMLVTCWHSPLLLPRPHLLQHRWQLLLQAVYVVSTAAGAAAAAGCWGLRVCAGDAQGAQVGEASWQLQESAAVLVCDKRVCWGRTGAHVREVTAVHHHHPPVPVPVHCRCTHPAHSSPPLHSPGADTACAGERQSKIVPCCCDGVV